MTLLAVESSTALGGVAVFKDGLVLAENSTLKQRSHSEFMNSALQKILAEQKISLENIDQIAVTTGPGSFTGVRVAGNLAKTLAYSLGKKIWATDSLTVLASQISWNEPTLVGINAFKNLLYASFYKGTEKLFGPTVVELSSFRAAIESQFGKSPFYYLGDAMPVISSFIDSDLKSRFLKIPNSSLRLSEHPTAALLGRLFFNKPDVGQTLDWNSYVPLYLRSSEAEENLRLRASENS